jgi:hypothetical protein
LCEAGFSGSWLGCAGSLYKTEVMAYSENAGMGE